MIQMKAKGTRLGFSKVKDISSIAEIIGAVGLALGQLHNAGILDTVADDSRWGLLYFDDGAALYARRETDRPLPTFFERADPRKLTPPALARTDPELERELQLAIERAPHSSIVRFALASQLRAGGQIELARALLAEAWHANPLQPAAPELATAPLPARRM